MGNVWPSSGIWQMLLISMSCLQLEDGLPSSPKIATRDRTGLMIRLSGQQMGSG
jgi:hypothetical protein